MLLDTCLGTRTSWKILFVLAETPGKAISRKEIRALTKIGNRVLVKFLLLLEKFGLITTKKIGREYYYTMSLSNPYAGKLLEIIALEKKTLNNPDFIVLNILRDLTYELTNAKLENLRNIILFGSYAKRTATPSSDIDVAIISEKKDLSHELLITDIVDRLRLRYGKEIQPHYFTAQEFYGQKKSLLMQEISRDGIILL